MTTQHFTHPGRHGRRYSLVRRGAILYLYFEEKGERILKSTGSGTRDGAVQWSRNWLDARAQGNKAALDRLLQRGGSVPTSTVGELLAWWDHAALQLREQTQRSYANCLRLVLSRVYGERVDSLPLGDVLTKETPVRWRDATLRGLAGRMDSAEARRAMRTSNSILNQARCLLSPVHCELAKVAGLVLPDLSHWQLGLKLARFRVPGKSAHEWAAPTQQQVDALLSTWRALLTEVSAGDAPLDRRNLAAAIWLELACGLRLGEVAQVTWPMVVPAFGLRGEMRLKNHAESLTQRALEPFWSEGFRALADTRGADQYVISGCDTERLTGVGRRVGELLRSLGWTSHKTNHSLRALAGYWVTRQWGLREGRDFLRHASVTTTEAHYEGAMKASALVVPGGLDWAGSGSLNTTHES